VREAHERVSCIEELSLGHDAGRRQDHMPHKPGSKAAAETVRKHNKVASCSTMPQHSRPHAQAQEHAAAPLQQDAHITSRPQKQEHSTRLTANFAGRNET